MTTYVRRPERERVEAFRAGEEPPEWFAGDGRGRWRRTAAGAYIVYFVRTPGCLWRPVHRGDYVVHNGPEAEFAVVGAEQFEWLYREEGSP